MRFFLIFLIFLIFSTDCGLDKLTSKFFSIDIQAVYESPTVVSGSLEPFSETLTLEKIKLVNEAGDEVLLYDGEAVSFRVNTERLSLVKRKITSTLWNQNYGKLIVVFSNSIKVRSKSEHDVVLDNGDVSYDSAFSIIQGKNISFLIKMKWKSTVNRNTDTGEETAEPPEFKMVLE